MSKVRITVAWTQVYIAIAKAVVAIQVHKYLIQMILVNWACRTCIRGLDELLHERTLVVYITGSGMLISMSIITCV